MYLWYTEHNSLMSSGTKWWVVNCFQNVSLIYRTQLCKYWTKTANSCELLSKCIFDIPNTTGAGEGAAPALLWIAFKMYLWYTEHNLELGANLLQRVVNCFQNVSLIYRTQLAIRCSAAVLCCELLSKCIFDIPNTTTLKNMNDFTVLWIAFKMYLWYTEHNNTLKYERFYRVVNCFQNVSLIYRTQRDLCIQLRNRMLYRYFQIKKATRSEVKKRQHGAFYIC